MTSTNPLTQGTAPGGILGVVSKSKDTSLRVYNNRSKYNEWVFIATQMSQGPGGQGGTQVPGGRGGDALGAGRGRRGAQPPDTRGRFGQPPGGVGGPGGNRPGGPGTGTQGGRPAGRF